MPAVGFGLSQWTWLSGMLGTRRRTITSPANKYAGGFALIDRISTMNVVARPISVMKEMAWKMRVVRSVAFMICIVFIQQ